MNVNSIQQLNPKNEMVIHDEDISTHGIQACWRACNNIMAFVSSETTSAETLQGPFSLYDVKWNADLHNDVGRKLVNESRLVFVAVQELSKDGIETPSFKEHCAKGRLLTLLMKVHRGRRERPSYVLFVLWMCRPIRDLYFLTHLGHWKVLSSVTEGTVVDMMHLYSMMELIWSLCEIMFIENLPDGVVLLRLMEWNKWHFPNADELVQECMKDSDTSPCNHSHYWDAIYALVLQGQISEARDLLKLHPKYQTQVYDAFSSIDELLRKMPTFQYSQGQSVSEFDMKWHYWHDECTKRLKDGDFDTKPELKVICKIICGDEDVIGDLNELNGSWYQMLIANLFYKHPTISTYDLHYHSKACIERCGGASDFTALDNILLAAFKFDVSQVIRECCDHLSSWWLPAHMADLLHYCQLLPAASAESGGNLREYLLVEYASSLSNLDCYWQVVTDYLAHCGPLSNHYLPLFIQKIPLSSEKKAHKVMKLCQKYDLTSEAHSVCRQMSRRALQNNRLGTALSWSVQAKDSSCAMYIANKMLEEYAQTGLFANIDLIDYLGPSSMLLSERLTFLVKYRDFHKLYVDGRFEEAAKLLFNLIVNAKAPMHFWLSLLTDSLPLLENEKLFYGIEETTRLLNCLNTLDQQQVFTDLTDDAAKEKHLKKMRNIRLALTNNLAKAIVS